MTDELPTAPMAIRLATPQDIALIEELDTFSTSPTRHISRELQKYFGSVDPSTHERTLIFLLEVAGIVAAKAELMLPPSQPITADTVNLAAKLAMPDDQVEVPPQSGEPLQAAEQVGLSSQPGESRDQLYGAGATGYLKRVVVHPDYRGQGLSRRLMEHIIAYAQNPLGLAAIDLHVWENNVPAIRLYESLGFQLQHRELYFHLPL